MRTLVRNLLLRCGWDVRRTVNAQQHKRAEHHRRELEAWKFLANYRPQTVLDIGANVGQFARLVRELLPGVRIVSFEPLADCVQKLQAAREELAPLDVLPYALGAEDGAAQIHRNNSTPSSSLLEMAPRHKQELPKTAQATPETIAIRRLDGLAPGLALQDPVFVKIDVQGYTEPVLRGGERTIRRAAAVVAEVSLQPLYRGETTFETAYDILSGWGFAYRGNVSQWVSPHDGRILQIDCLFENLSASPGAEART